MRIVFDVDSRNEPQICGSGTPYRNMVGFQGADDTQMSLTLIIPKNGDKDDADVVEFEGSGKAIVRMLKSALDAMEGTLEFSLRDLGPRRAAPCPECDPTIIYPNVTHTEECKASKF